jgi:three-Cys-motif partner protein
MGKNLHAKSFDKDTLTKLAIFEEYAKAWIPTFVMSGHPVICLFDFFAGTGYDKAGQKGSPVRILDQIKNQMGNIFTKKTKIILYLNEFDGEKFENLKAACEQYLKDNKNLKSFLKIEYSNRDFEPLFFELLSEIKKHPSLVYLDQNGVKYLSDKYLLELERMQQTDFLYFISSSYVPRFKETQQFKAHLNKIDTSASKQNPKNIHRIITEEIKNKLSIKTKLKLYPFSLKKGSNIYGIIFGASHVLAVDKFLSLAWKMNPMNGEANFDIDEDIKKANYDLFEVSLKKTKLQIFEEQVMDKILKKEITNNFDLYHFTLEQGHIGKHASDCLKKMKKDGKIDYESTSPLVTYDNVYKNKKHLEYKVLTK